MDDEHEVLDWGNEDDEHQEPCRKPSFTQDSGRDKYIDDDGEDAISLGDEEDDLGFYPYNQDGVVVGASQASTVCETPAGLSSPGKSQVAPGANDSRRGSRGHRREYSSSQDKDIARSQQPRLTHALPPKPMTTQVPYLPPTHPSIAMSMVNDSPRAPVREPKRSNGSPSKHSSSTSLDLRPGYAVAAVEEEFTHSARNHSKLYSDRPATFEDNGRRPRSPSTTNRHALPPKSHPQSTEAPHSSNRVPQTHADQEMADSVQLSASRTNDLSFADRHYRPGEPSSTVEVRPERTVEISGGRYSHSRHEKSPRSTTQPRRRGRSASPVRDTRPAYMPAKDTDYASSRETTKPDRRNAYTNVEPSMRDTLPSDLGYSDRTWVPSGYPPPTDYTRNDDRNPGRDVDRGSRRPPRHATDDIDVQVQTYEDRTKPSLRRGDSNRGPNRDREPPRQHDLREQQSNRNLSEHRHRPPHQRKDDRNHNETPVDYPRYQDPEAAPNRAQLTRPEGPPRFERQQPNPNNINPPAPAPEEQYPRRRDRESRQESNIEPRRRVGERAHERPQPDHRAPHENTRQEDDYLAAAELRRVYRDHPRPYPTDHERLPVEEVNRSKRAPLPPQNMTFRSVSANGWNPPGPNLPPPPPPQNGSSPVTRSPEVHVHPHPRSAKPSPIDDDSFPQGSRSKLRSDGTSFWGPRNTPAMPDHDQDDHEQTRSNQSLGEKTSNGYYSRPEVDSRNLILFPPRRPPMTSHPLPRGSSKRNPSSPNDAPLPVPYCNTTPPRPMVSPATPHGPGPELQRYGDRQPPSQHYGPSAQGHRHPKDREVFGKEDRRNHRMEFSPNERNLPSRREPPSRPDDAPRRLPPAPVAVSLPTHVPVDAPSSFVQPPPQPVPGLPLVSPSVTYDPAARPPPSALKNPRQGQAELLPSGKGVYEGHPDLSLAKTAPAPEDSERRRFPREEPERNPATPSSSNTSEQSKPPRQRKSRFDRPASSSNVESNIGIQPLPAVERLSVAQSDQGPSSDTRLDASPNVPLENPVRSHHPETPSSNPALLNRFSDLPDRRQFLARQNSTSFVEMTPHHRESRLDGSGPNVTPSVRPGAPPRQWVSQQNQPSRHSGLAGDAIEPPPALSLRLSSGEPPRPRDRGHGPRAEGNHRENANDTYPGNKYERNHQSQSHSQGERPHFNHRSYPPGQRGPSLMERLGDGSSAPPAHLPPNPTLHERLIPNKRDRDEMLKDAGAEAYDGYDGEDGNDPKRAKRRNGRAGRGRGVKRPS